MISVFAPVTTDSADTVSDAIASGHGTLVYECTEQCEMLFCRLHYAFSLRF